MNNEKNNETRRLVHAVQCSVVLDSLHEICVQIMTKVIILLTHEICVYRMIYINSFFEPCYSFHFTSQKHDTWQLLLTHCSGGSLGENTWVISNSYHCYHFVHILVQSMRYQMIVESKYFCLLYRVLCVFCPPLWCGEVWCAVVWCGMVCTL